MKLVSQFAIYNGLAEPVYLGYPVAGDDLSEAKRALGIIFKLYPPPAQIAYLGIVPEEVKRK